MAGGLAGAAASCSGERTRWVFLSAAEAETAGAICEQLIPSDAFPGALWAGAVDHIDRQLPGPLRKHREVYRAGLAAADACSRKTYCRRLVELESARHVELLSRIETGQAPGDWTPARQMDFFAALRTHTMQSNYGDPGHGGNRDQVGYRSLGIPAASARSSGFIIKTRVHSTHGFGAVNNSGQAAFFPRRH